MLKKLLKYDLRATFKYWWVAAVSSLGLAVLCGFATKILSDPELSQSIVFSILSVLIVILTVIGTSAFIVAAEIFIYVRFYQNFFSDEGYLTFTLPVKRHQLLNSKIISAMLVSFATIMVVFLDIFTVIFVHSGFEMFTSEFLGYIFEIFGIAIDGAFAELGFLAVVYIIEFIVLIFLSALFGLLMVFAAITFAAMITKKNKVIAAIGIYYGANSVISIVMQVIMTISLTSVNGWLTIIPTDALSGLGSILLLVSIALVGAATVALYAFVHWMLDRKLNLA